MKKYSKFDIVLLVVALMIMLMIIGMFTFLELVFIASVISLAVIGYGIFISPPTDLSSRGA